jgi:hypothetical protein
LKLKYDDLLPDFAFSFSLRPSTTAPEATPGCNQTTEGLTGGLGRARHAAVLVDGALRVSGGFRSTASAHPLHTQWTLNLAGW